MDRAAVHLFEDYSSLLQGLREGGCYRDDYTVSDPYFIEVLRCVFTQPYLEKNTYQV